MHRKLFSVCKTLGLSNSRVESWEKLSGRKTKVGSVLRRSRWDSASVFAPGGSSSLCGSHAGRISRGEWAENRERVKSILLPSSCIRTLCTVVQASCPPDKKSILPQYICSAVSGTKSFYHIAKPPVSVFNSDINVFLIWLPIPRTWARKLESVISGVGNLAQATEIDGEVDQHQKTETQTVRHTSQTY